MFSFCFNKLPEQGVPGTLFANYTFTTSAIMLLLLPTLSVLLQKICTQNSLTEDMKMIAGGQNHFLIHEINFTACFSLMDLCV